MGTQEITLEKVMECLTRLESKYDKSTADTKEMMKKEFQKMNINIDKKIKPVVKRVTDVEQKVGVNSEKINNLEKEKRKRNVVIFGLEQDQNENFKSLEEKVLKMIRDKMEIEIYPFEVDFIKRIGKSNDKKPVLMGLTTWKRKMEIISNGKKLKDSGISVKEDYPPEVQEIRKKLFEDMKTEREKGNKAYIRYNKLIVEAKPTETDNNDNRGKGKEKEEGEPIEDVDMSTHDGNKRKAETPLEPVKKNSNVLKKYITLERRGSAGSLLTQSKLDPFLNSSQSNTPNT
uniref:Endonuclease-reverse transcriptase n=2 Tax=Cacopsylla melanoneura TaxID=428564 RepID=A0A8D9BR67_9HEMI